MTGALGGTPSATGVEASAFAGAIAGSIAFVIKMRLGPAKGKSAPETYYRYVGEKELHATRSKNMLRPGKDSPHYFTSTRYNSAIQAQAELSIPITPKYGIRFRFLEPQRVLGGTKVNPKFNQPGGGVEYWIDDDAAIEILEVFHLV